MKKALKVSEFLQIEEPSNPIEITHFFNEIKKRWTSREEYINEDGIDINYISKGFQLIHIGFCRASNCDMFICIYPSIITFYKGFFNDGTYNEK